MLKPDTDYTIALDTDKSSSLTVDIDGVKSTTTSNVVKLRTPRKLQNSNLRLSAKGVKSSKIRVFEGDKTEWIPLFFKGMKSAFEDTVQEDGKYKMEILSNNKNLFNGTWKYDERDNRIYSNDLIPVKPNTTYTISDNLNYRYQIYEYSTKNKHFNSMYPYHGSYTFKTRYKTRFLRFSTYAPSTDINVKFMLQEEKSVTPYVPHKSNKIQFLLDEPLRSVGDVRDKFVLKDGKLMIERNCGINILNGSEKWDKHSLTDSDLRKDVFVGVNWYQAPIQQATDNNLLMTNVFSRRDTIHGNSLYITGQSHILTLNNDELISRDEHGLKHWLSEHNIKYVYIKETPTYEEIPHELQKIILEGYENGTLSFNTDIAPKSTIKYSAKSPIVESIEKNQTKVSQNTMDINDNILPYLMDMDYRVVCLEVAGGDSPVQVARLFGGTFEMLKRDIKSQRYSNSEYRNRIEAYLNTGKISQSEYQELGEMLND